MRKPPQRRLDSRYALLLPVEIVADGAPIHGQSVDIGFGGLRARVSSDAPPPPVGTGVRVCIAVPRLETPLTLPGVLRWSQGGHVGVGFEAPSARALWVLHRLFP